MAKQRVKFTFPSELITLPIIYELGKQYSIITNVRRADVTEDRGWVVLEMDGPIEEIERALEWVAGKGVRVDPVQGDIERPVGDVGNSCPRPAAQLRATRGGARAIGGTAYDRPQRRRWREGGQRHPAKTGQQCGRHQR